MAEAALAPAAVAGWAPLRVPTYRYLLVGQTTSLLGDQLLVVAIPFIVLGAGAGATGLGTVFAAYGLARIVALPVGGWLGDRVSRRGVMIGSDLTRGALLITLATMVGAAADLSGVVPIMAAVGLAEGVFLPASYAILPQTVPADLLARANGLSTGAQNLALLVGPGLGGLLVATLDPRWCLWLDAATFAVSVATLWSIRPRTLSTVDSSGDGGEDRGTTLRWLFTDPLMRTVTALTLVSNLAYYGMLEVALPVSSRGGPPYGYGAALAAFGLGSLAGALLIARLDRMAHRGLVACAIGVVQGACFAAIAAGAGLGATMLLLAVAGLSVGVLNVFYLSRVQERVPGRLLGRAMSLLMLAVFAIHPASVALAGVVTAGHGPAVVFAVAGLSIVVAFTAGAATRTYRGL